MNQLDAYTVMHLSSTVAERLPLQLAHNPGKIKAPDALPGWIERVAVPEVGGERDEEDEVGELGPGGKMSLRERKRYRCYAEGEGIEEPKVRIEGRRYSKVSDGDG